MAEYIWPTPRVRRDLRSLDSARKSSELFKALPFELSAAIRRETILLMTASIHTEVLSREPNMRLGATNLVYGCSDGELAILIYRRADNGLCRFYLLGFAPASSID